MSRHIRCHQVLSRGHYRDHHHQQCLIPSVYSLPTTSLDRPRKSQASQHTILSIGTSQSQDGILTDCFKSQERAWVYICTYIRMEMGTRIRIRHKLPPNSAGASFSSTTKFPTVSAAYCRRYGMRIGAGIMHRLPASSAGTSFLSLPNTLDRERC